MSENIAQMISNILGHSINIELPCSTLIHASTSTRYQEETQGVSSAWVVHGASDFLHIESRCMK